MYCWSVRSFSQGMLGMHGANVKTVRMTPSVYVCVFVCESELDCVPDFYLHH